MTAVYSVPDDEPLCSVEGNVAESFSDPWQDSRAEKRDFLVMVWFRMLKRMEIYF